MMNVLIVICSPVCDPIPLAIPFTDAMLPSSHMTYCAKIGRGDNRDVGTRRWEIGGYR